jgi:hypothetical protein
VNTSHQAGRPLLVELLALDLSTCGRCTRTDRNIESAVKELRPLLTEAGVDLQFRKTVVQSVDQATALRFRSSPTMRINGRDVPIEFRESRCGDCTSLAGGGSCAVDCRVWVWQGREFTEAPTGLVVDAVLRAYPLAFDAPPTPANEPFELPDNLKRFFSSRGNDGNKATRPCCAEPQSKFRAVSKRSGE